MNQKELLDIYSDYLVSAFGPTTGTGLSELLNGSLSHDQVQRFLAGPVLTAADLWQRVKPHGRAIQPEDGVIIIDDSIAENPIPMRTRSSAGITTIQRAKYQRDQLCQCSVACQWVVLARWL